MKTHRFTGPLLAGSILLNACAGDGGDPAPAGAIGGAAAAVPPEPGPGVAEIVQAVQVATAWFRDTSTMRGSTTDWDPWRGKAGCASSEALTGLSVDPGDHQGRTALCGAETPSRFTGQPTATLLVDGANHQQTQRNGDFAPGDWKLECGSGQYVSAVSENTTQHSGDNRFHGLQCAQGANLAGNERCTARVFGGGDARGETASGDWDPGAYKGECAVNEYVVGVSVSTTTGGPNSLLCCSANPESRNVGLYSDSNYRGASQSLAPGVYPLDQLTIGNDTLSSITIPSGMVAKLYEHDRYGGASLVLNASNADLWYAGFADKASSIAVYRPISEPDGSPRDIGAITDVEELKFKVAHDPAVIKNLAYLAGMLGFAWCGGTRSPNAGEDFDVVRNSDGSYSMNAHYNSSDPYASGYMADRRLRMMISNFRIAIDPSTFVYGSPTITTFEPVRVSSGLARNPNDTESTISITLDSSHTNTYSHETNVSFTEGVKLSIKNKAEVPFLAGTELTTEFSFSATEGWKDTTTTIDIIADPIEYSTSVPPHSQKGVTMVGLRTRSNIHYTAVASVTFDVAFYGFLAFSGNARSDHPTNRPFVTATFNSAGRSGLEAILYMYDHSYIDDLEGWDWHWIKAAANGYLGSTIGFFRRGITVPLNGQFTGVLGTNVTFTEDPVQPLSP